MIGEQKEEEKAQSVFIDVFGENPAVKILDFLITFKAFDYPLTEIAKNAKISYSTLQTIWPRLEQHNLIIKTRRIGKSDLFKLNTDNPAVQQLIQLDWNLIRGSEAPGNLAA